MNEKAKNHTHTILKDFRLISKSDWLYLKPNKKVSWIANDERTSTVSNHSRSYVIQFTEFEKNVRI